jgi:aminopeptidase N
MKCATFIFLMCLMFGLNAQTEMESHAKQELLKHRELQSYNSKRSLSRGVDIQHVRLYFEPNLSNGRLNQASAKITFKAVSTLSLLVFDLRKELTVDSVVFRNNAINFNHTSQHELRINVGVNINANAIDSIAIYYQGTPNMASRAYFRSVTSSGPNIATLSQPYGAHYWWPCMENLNDKIDSLDVSIKVDSGFVAVSNGLLTHTDTVGNKLTFHFKHRYPIVTYLVALSISRYDKFVQKAFLPSINKEIDIVNYTFPHDDINDNKNKSFETIKMMRLFDSLFGTYPFHKEQYGHMQFAWSGGMEHQTMSSMSNLNYDLIAHELAHQWFGDKVTCGTWQELWLNEGFATYLNLLCYDFLRPRQEWLNVLNLFKEDVMELPNGSVYVNDTSNLGRLFDYRTTYQKGAMILHQLRWEIGDKAFFDALKKYINDAQLSYSFVKQTDLKQYLESESGINLDDYFNDWVFGEGYPEYNINWQQKGNELVLSVIQKPSHSSVNQFNVPLPILVVGQNKDTLLRVDINGLEFEKSILLDFKIKEILVDPYHQIIAKSTIQFPIDQNALISIYPNPSDNTLYFSLSNADISGWKITDATGKSILEKTYNEAIASGNIGSINTSKLTSGLYILELLSTDNRKIIRKINIKH